MLNLTLACGHYDRTRPRGRTCTARRHPLNCLTLKVEETFWRMMQYREFDVAETSLGGYVVRRGRGADDLVAIPVFPSRFFRQPASSFTAARRHSTRRKTSTVSASCVQEYQMTAAVWARGALSDDYGVRPQDVECLQGGLEDPARLPFEPVEPAGIRLSSAPPDRSLARMLGDGEIHALITARTPSTFDPAGSGVRRLFRDFLEGGAGTTSTAPASSPSCTPYP